MNVSFQMIRKNLRHRKVTFFQTQLREIRFTYKQSNDKIQKIVLSYNVFPSLFDR